MNTISHSAHQWCSSLGWSAPMLAGKLAKAGITKKPREVITANEIKMAILGDEQFARIKLMELQAKKLAREEREAMAELFPKSELEAWLTAHYCVPMANILAGAAGALAVQCNPDNPEVARTALAGWIENTFKPFMKEQIKTPEPSAT